jgi:hypothetical protein
MKARPRKGRPPVRAWPTKGASCVIAGTSAECSLGVHKTGKAQREQKTVRFSPCRVRGPPGPSLNYKLTRIVKSTYLGNGNSGSMLRSLACPRSGFFSLSRRAERAAFVVVPHGRPAPGFTPSCSPSASERPSGRSLPEIVTTDPGLIISLLLSMAMPWPGGRPSTPEPGLLIILLLFSMARRGRLPFPLWREPRAGHAASSKISAVRSGMSIMTSWPQGISKVCQDGSALTLA